MTHRQMTINLKNVGPRRIDEKMVELVTALCDLGLETHMSCQNNVDDRAWVSFKKEEHARTFLELIAKDDGDLRYFVQNATTEYYDKRKDRFKLKGRWWVDVYVRPVLDANKFWNGDLASHISVRFPKKHLKEVTKIIMAARDQEPQRVYNIPRRTFGSGYRIPDYSRPVGIMNEE